MNREHWKALLPKIEAFANGEDVQYFSCGEWTSCEKLSFMDDPEKYRIAPKEKTGWVNIYPDYSVGKIYETRKNADDSALPNRIACIQITYKEGDGL